jgi:hypothetical protein
MRVWSIGEDQNGATPAENGDAAAVGADEPAPVSAV